MFTLFEKIKCKMNMSINYLSNRRGYVFEKHIVELTNRERGLYGIMSNRGLVVLNELSFSAVAVHSLCRI